MVCGLKKASTLWKGLAFGTAATVLLSFLMIDMLRIEVTQASILSLPEPTKLLTVSKEYSLPLLKGIKLNENDPLQVSFIIDAADQGKVNEQEAQKLVNYFMAALTVPEENLWVNLSPYENDRIMDDKLAITDLGKEFLAQDYVLKQFSSSLTYPESSMGKEFWSRAQEKILEIDPSARVDINTFNKIWIVPGSVKIHEEGYSAIVSESSLKTMMEEDYLARDINKDKLMETASTYDPDSVAGVSQVSSQVMREFILPEIEHEVNNGKHFSNLRQVYHSIVLAMWFKQKFKDSFYKHYFDQAKLDGIDIEDKDVKEKIYNLYTEAFQKGVYDYIGKAVDPITKEKQKRRYFSGGMNMAQSSALVLSNTEQVKLSDVFGYLKGEHYAFKTRWRQDTIENWDHQEAQDKRDSAQVTYDRSLNNIRKFKEYREQDGVSSFSIGEKEYLVTRNNKYILEFDHRDGILKRAKQPRKVPLFDTLQARDVFVHKLFRKAEVLANSNLHEAQLRQQQDLFAAVEKEQEGNDMTLARLAQVRKDFWSGFIFKNLSDGVLLGKKVYRSIAKGPQMIYGRMVAFQKWHNSNKENRNRRLEELSQEVNDRLSSAQDVQQQQELGDTLEDIAELRERVQVADKVAKSLKPIGLMSEAEIKEEAAKNEQAVVQELLDDLANDFEGVVQSIADNEASETLAELFDYANENLDSVVGEIDRVGTEMAINDLSNYAQNKLDSVAQKLNEIENNMSAEQIGNEFKQNADDVVLSRQAYQNNFDNQERVAELEQNDPFSWKNTIESGSAKANAMYDNLGTISQRLENYENKFNYNSSQYYSSWSDFISDLQNQNVNWELLGTKLEKSIEANYTKFFAAENLTIQNIEALRYALYNLAQASNYNGYLAEMFETYSFAAPMALDTALEDAMQEHVLTSIKEMDYLKNPKAAAAIKNISDISQVQDIYYNEYKTNELFYALSMLARYENQNRALDWQSVVIDTIKTKSNSKDAEAFAQEGVMAEDQASNLVFKTIEHYGDRGNNFLIKHGVNVDSLNSFLNEESQNSAEYEKLKSVLIANLSRGPYGRKIKDGAPVSETAQVADDLAKAIRNENLVAQSSSVDYGGIDMAGIEIEIDGASSPLVYIPFDVENFNGFHVSAISLEKVEDNSKLLAML